MNAVEARELQPAIFTAKAKPLSAAEVKDHVNLIQEVLRTVMIEGTHYDTIPGTDKPSLLKPGAEKILTTFRISCIPRVEDLSTDDEVRYRVTVQGVHQTTGIIVGEGVGECSSNEEKYRWRSVVCQAEWDATPEGRRRVKYGRKQGGGHYEAQQIRTVPADVANTVLKMAKKRAMVDMTLTATAASDVFAQDLEDMPPELREAHKQSQRQHNARPRTATGNAGKPASEQQCRLLRVKLNQAGKQEADLCKAFEVETLEGLAMGQVNDAIAWISQ